MLAHALEQQVFLCNQAGLKLVILLPQHPMCWDYRLVALRSQQTTFHSKQSQLAREYLDSGGRPGNAWDTVQKSSVTWVALKLTLAADHLEHLILLPPPPQPRL